MGSRKNLTSPVLHRAGEQGSREACQSSSSSLSGVRQGTNLLLALPPAEVIPAPHQEPGAGASLQGRQAGDAATHEESCEQLGSALHSCSALS